MSGIKLPFALSLAGHAACLVALALFLSTKPPPLMQPTAKGGIEVVFEPAPPKQEATPASPEAVQRRRLKRIVTDTCISCCGIPAGKGGKVAPRIISWTDWSRSG